MIVTCILIEDEPLAAEKLVGFIKKVPFLELKENFQSSVLGLNYLKENSVDLVFLDIQMDSLTGIDLLESLSKKPAIILTTAFQEYALQGYELRVSDYLLKPYSFVRFLKAVDKVYDELLPSHPTPEIAQDCIFVKTEYRIEKVEIQNILYIEGMSDYLRIHLAGGKKIMSLQSFKSYEAILPKINFIRVHKSFLIAMDKIESIERQRVKIADQLIPISDTYKADFFARIENKGLL
ncbi:MAG: LytTR family DNA-binding domain-containing protein [Bacteroidetes bacterium]|nr:LytTR family DNA-binding domain-containing protein [Bacteroidota bacterium]